MCSFHCAHTPGVAQAMCSFHCAHTPSVAQAMCSFHCAHTPDAAGLFRLRSIRPATRLFRLRSIRRFRGHRLCARFTARIRLVWHRLCARFTARIRLMPLGYFACAQYAQPRAYFACAQYGALAALFSEAKKYVCPNGVNSVKWRGGRIFVRCDLGVLWPISW